MVGLPWFGRRNFSTESKVFQKFPQQLEQTGLLHISVLHKFNYDDNFIIIIFVIIIFIIITYPVRLLNDVKS